MQRSINFATGFNPASVKGLKFSANMHEECGHIGEYWCKAETLEDAKAGAIEAASQYMGSIFGEGEKITRISFSEKMRNGNAVSRGSIEL